MNYSNLNIAGMLPFCAAECVQIVCKWHHSSAVNKDLTFKANDLTHKAKDLTSEQVEGPL